MLRICAVEKKLSSFLLKFWRPGGRECICPSQIYRVRLGGFEKGASGSLCFSSYFKYILQCGLHWRSYLVEEISGEVQRGRLSRHCSHSPSPLPSSAQPWHTDDTETQLNRNTNWRGWVQQGRSGNQLSALINFCIKHTLSVVCYQLLAETKQLGQGKTATALIWIMVIGWLIRAPVVNHNRSKQSAAPVPWFVNKTHVTALLFLEMSIWLNF